MPDKPIEIKERIVPKVYEVDGKLYLSHSDAASAAIMGLWSTYLGRAEDNPLESRNLKEFLRRPEIKELLDIYLRGS